MAEQQLFLVVYDISNNKRRTKLHDFLLDFGKPVQYSVFECLLDKEQKKLLFQKIQKKVKPKIDSLRIYLICNECVKKVKIIGGVEVLAPTKEAIIVG
jgi:CRISPR-associated protein Cas2